jgi:large subunit ribosomal protein L3
MTYTLFAQKHGMTEAYLGDKRVAVTKLELYDTAVLRDKSVEQDGYTAQVLSFGKAKKHASQAQTGKDKTQVVRKFTREVKSSEAVELTPGMIVNIQAISKGKGFAGVMKRWNFRGGPRTHGQSDRARAPGSIGQGTTPGRVLKGKHMAGRMGSDKVTVRNLTLVALDLATKSLWISGPVPGTKGGLVKLVVTDQTTMIEELKFLKGYNAPKVQEVVPEVVTEEVVEVQG